MIRRIELLAPAKNKECAIAAVNHGADAVYMGLRVTEPGLLRAICPQI
jgi:collagenase-like PrtC family protease